MGDSERAERRRYQRHFEAMANAMCERRVIPFLGAGASLCDRPDDAEWKPAEEILLPKASELASYLAERYRYPSEAKESKEGEEVKEDYDLARVAQYAAIKNGAGPLYETLQRIFDKNYQPTRLHQFLAKLPGFFRRKNLVSLNNPLRQRLVIVTTNYDDLLEQAFEQENEPYHKLVYMAEAAKYGDIVAAPGSFLHWTPDRHLSLVEVPNEYVVNDEYEACGRVEQFPTIIAKIHGAVVRGYEYNPQEQRASYVITEDHYLDYLTRTEISDLLPGSTAAVLKNSNFLFLGYSLRDWNLRVMCRRIWKEQRLGYKSWAVQRHPTEIDELYWSNQGVEIVNMELADYARNLHSEMEAYHV